MIEVVQELVVTKGVQWSRDLEDDLPSGWQRHGDLLLFGDGCFSQAVWQNFGKTSTLRSSSFNYLIVIVVVFVAGGCGGCFNDDPIFNGS